MSASIALRLVSLSVVLAFCGCLEAEPQLSAPVDERQVGDDSGAAGDRSGRTVDEPAAPCSTPNAACTLRQAAVASGVFMGSTSSGPGWTSGELGGHVSTHFSSVTTENDLKWGGVASAPGIYDFEAADETVAFAASQGLRLRGHTLFWHRLNGFPEWLPGELNRAADPEARLRAIMAEHVSTVVGRYRGKMESWDVLNEPLAVVGGGPDTDSIFFQNFDEYDDFIALAFELARDADPDARLFLNEIFPSIQAPKFQGLLALVTRLLERGVPIDGVGFQGHFVVDLPDYETLKLRLQAFADLGLDVELTEVDVSIALLDDAPDPLEAQADVYRDVVQACVDVARCTGVTMWNAHDGLTWLDRDALFRVTAPHQPTLFNPDLTPKPAYTAIVEVLRQSLRESL